METGAPVTDGAAEMGSPTILSDGLLRPPYSFCPPGFCPLPSKRTFIIES